MFSTPRWARPAFWGSVFALASGVVLWCLFTLPSLGSTGDFVTPLAVRSTTFTSITPTAPATPTAGHPRPTWVMVPEPFPQAPSTPTMDLSN